MCIVNALSFSIVHAAIRDTVAHIQTLKAAASLWSTIFRQAYEDFRSI